MEEINTNIWGNYMKKIIFLITLLLLSSSLVLAHGEETFAEAEEIIESKISCDQLTDEQLEVIGDYYMEQMHPGEEHERMGGEGSESLRLMHINMAKSFYCGEHDAMSSGMMSMMMGGGMMDFSTFKNNKNIIGGENMAYGMMSTGMGAWSLYGLVYFIVIAFIFSVIFWLTHNWLVKGKKK